MAAMRQMGTYKPLRYLLSFGGPAVHRVVFRQAVAEDADRLFDLSLPMMEGGALVTRKREFFGSQYRNFWVLDVDGRTVGTIGLEPLGGLVEFFNLCVQRALQGQGLGRLLLPHVLAVAQEEGFRRVVLLSKTAEDWF